MNDFEYTYPFASMIKEASTHQKNFIFSHCSELKEDNAVPCFFWGNITQPFVVAKCLALQYWAIRIQPLRSQLLLSPPSLQARTLGQPQSTPTER